MGNGSRDDIVKRSETFPFPEQNLDENIPILVHNINGFAMSWMKIFTNNDVNTPNSEAKNSEQQIAIGSSNVPETPDESAEIQTESGGTRRGRGRTLLKDLYELTPVEHVKVSRNNLGQPIGLEARLLIGYLGIIARNANMLPINYES
ncbi:hypothetical protein PVK06_027385 [Gossypium arboreum]|uniref:Uncharacterized protein n=1 Tax=Gossypium arboreum TaxID=29729 RepID=A0ABR0P3M2_GOSAR|nr:hypothetical protein PVK06_027385 [Gossypium arboreum]